MSSACNIKPACVPVMGAYALCPNLRTMYNINCTL